MTSKNTTTTAGIQEANAAVRKVFGDVAAEYHLRYWSDEIGNGYETLMNELIGKGFTEVQADDILHPVLGHKPYL